MCADEWFTSHALSVIFSGYPAFSCGTVFTNDTGRLSSVKANITAQNPYVCQWKIMPKNSNFDVIQLEISDFKFQDSGNANCIGA